ncbi:MAG: hypothetical protein HY821_15500 [Acidobacteria bacterium]|nr:hypothetical protein [Acidobacteriota bacterium]
MLAEIVLTAALAQWKGDIEARSGLPLVVAETEYEANDHSFRLAPDTPQRAAFIEYLQVENFRRQYMQMYAVMIHHKAAGGSAYLVMLNGMRRADWKGHEEALIAHEFGHAWIKAQGYPTPIFIDNQWACVGVHSGDVVQHGLIRSELDKRGIEYRKFWLGGLETATLQMETSPSPAPEDRCARIRVAAQWLDVKLGLKPGEWPAQARYEAALRKWMPEVEPTVDQIVNLLKGKDLSDKDVHRAALKAVFEALKDLGYERSKPYRVYVTLKETPRVS